ncbi:MAG: transglutaminase-like cysteine peptidase [Magnetococcales bacterium]|nr:transglutaminase-like cysteine peptidase [Magnetococcales bacterium]
MKQRTRRYFFSSVVMDGWCLSVLVWVVGVVPVAQAMEPDGLLSMPLFREAIPQEDRSGRSAKLDHAFSLHAQRKPALWAGDLLALQELPMVAKLRAAQELVNQRIAYQNDPDNIWKPPFDAYRSGGDCEDYAIAKLLLLRESGFPENRMRMITLAPQGQNRIYHVILVAQWQDKIFILDSPKRTPDGQVVVLDQYRDANRPVVWAGWSGGSLAKSAGVGVGSKDALPRVVQGGAFGPYGPLRMPSYREFPVREKLVRIAANLLVIRPGEPKLTPEEIERLRLLRVYFHDPTPENAQPLTRFELQKLEELRQLRKRG